MGSPGFVTSVGRLVRIDDTSLFVEERGAGAPVIVLHGGPGLDHHEFGDYLDPLGDDFRLLLVDQRAQGRSEPAPPETWTLARMAQDVIMLARALRLDRYAVFGHSFGAFVALQNAVDYPGMAAATIVCGGIPSARWLVAVERNLEVFEPADVRRRVADSWERETSVQTHDEFARMMADQLPFDFADPLDPRIGDYVKRTKDTVYAPDVLRAFSAQDYGAIELEDRLGEVASPTLVLAGRYDRVCAPEASEAIAKGIPGAELHIFEEGGHMTFVERPEEFIAVVRDFLVRTLPARQLSR
ncbi:MAG: alpha/beta fold hydrolase [Actinomycetota bacterium]|nr:alpha/beta fold hydrolase [Actinomycetota bacterium]